MLFVSQFSTDSDKFSFNTRRTRSSLVFRKGETEKNVAIVATSHIYFKPICTSAVTAVKFVYTLSGPFQTPEALVLRDGSKTQDG